MIYLISLGVEVRRELRRGFGELRLRVPPGPTLAAAADRAHQAGPVPHLRQRAGADARQAEDQTTDPVGAGTSYTCSL